MSVKIGDKIKTLREAKGISQRQLASLIKMNSSQYSKIERDIVDPRISTIQKICSGLNISLSDFFLSFNTNENDNHSMINKISMIERLSSDEQKSIFDLIEKLISKK